MRGTPRPDLHGRLLQQALKRAVRFGAGAWQTVARVGHTVLRYTDQAYDGEMCVIDAEAVGATCS